MVNEAEIGYLTQVNNETNEGYQYPVSEDYLIGSSIQCNLKITDNGILDQHCCIKLVRNEVCVFSLSSQNPVFLNNEPVSEEGKPLKDQDKIRVDADHEFEWKSATHRKICSRSLPLENEPSSVEVNARYSDSALSAWKKVDRVPEEPNEETTVAPPSPVSEEKDESVKVDEAPELLKIECMEKSNVSISCEINRSSAECGSKIKHSENTPVKSRKSKNPVSPFRVSNAFVSDSRNDVSKSLHRDDNDETNLECSTKNVPEDEFEDLVMHHSTSQKPFHSTPKAVSASKIRKNTRPSLLIDLNLETTVENDSSKTQTCGDESEKIDELNEESTCKDSNPDKAKKPTSASKKNVSTPTKRACEGLNESRRNTRGRTSLLRKTFEENSCDNEVKSLTTPEKLTETNITQALFAGDSEMENVTDTLIEDKYLNESSKSGFASASDDNDTCETSYIDKYKICNVIKNVSVSKPAVAKCARNLSYISPPENNRSQEYMDSMTSTPQKNSSPPRESIADSATSILSNTKDTSFDESMNISISSARKRRSTGFTPFVGTPSNEYRVTRKMSTPFSRSTLCRTSVDFDIGSSRDGKNSSERSSTPFKAPPGKSSIRDSFSCQPTIQESVSFEELEANNHEHDSINDSKFRNITKRRGRRRFGESIFAAEDKILEESELKSDASELDGDCSFDEENAEESITQTSTFLEDCDELSADDKTKTETIKNPFELKSILTPGPKSTVPREKSAKRVTFAFPSSAESSLNKEDTTASVDETFAMITWKQDSGTKQSTNSDCAISDEEMQVSDQQETDPSFTSVSELEDDASVTNSVGEKCDESSLNVTGVEYLANIQSNLNDLSGVEQIQSPEPSPMKCTSTETDNDGIEVNEKTDTLNEVPERSPVNFTEMESSLAFSEPSNRSNIATETHNKIGSSKEIAQIAADKNLSSSSTKISCSPGVHLSGVKSLFNTPEKSRSSLIDKGIKCNLNFNILSSTKAKNEAGTKLKSASASKSIGAINQTASVKPSRLCKSLVLGEMISLKPGTKTADEIQIEPWNVTVETPENETVTHDSPNEKVISAEPITEPEATNEERTVDHEIPEIVVTEATFVDENANNEQMELTEDREEAIIENPKAESPNKVQLVEDDTAEFETSDFEDKLSSDLDEISTSEYDSTEMTDDTCSPIITQVRRSTVLKAQSDSKIIPSDADKIQSEENKSSSTIDLADAEKMQSEENKLSVTIDLADAEKIQSEEIKSSATTDLADANKIQSEENKSSATIDFVESEPKKEIVSNASFNIISSVPDVVLPSSECNEEPTNELQSSSEYVTLDPDNSQISDILSSEYTVDANSSKTTIDESSCNNSQLTDFSAKDVSDLDSLKINVNESVCNISQLSDSPTEDNNDLDTWKNNPVDDIFDHQFTKLIFDDEPVSAELSESNIEEPIHVELSENNINVKTKIIECLSAENITQDDIGENLPESNDVEPCDPNMNVSQSTTSSQEMGIRINASSALINDLHKVLEDTPHPSKSSSVEATPIETFKPISFPDSTNISSIECTSSRPDISTKPDLPSGKISNEVFTPIKTYVRGSSTPQSAVRRCRKSSRIHRCNTNDSLNKPCPTVHDCSIVLDNSQTKSDTETTQDPKEIYKQVVVDLEAKLVGVKKKIDEAQKLPAKEKSPEKVNESVSCSESAPSTDPISSSIPFVQSSDDENIVTTSSTDMLTTNDDLLEHQSVNETAENTGPESEESSSIPEVTVETSEIPTVTESIEHSKTLLITLVANEEAEIEETASTLSVDAISEKRRSLRTRKGRSAASVVDISNQGVVTRNRQKAPSLKTKMKQLIQELSESNDDKENVCSVLKVVDKPEKMELSSEQIYPTAPPVTEKKGRRTRQLKNVENIASEPESEQDDENVKSCSIVLPVLNPEIIKSPVKVDESGNISSVEDPSVASKRKRGARTTNTTTEPKPAPAKSRTRQKSVKTVTFDVAQKKSEEAEQPVEKNVRSKATTSKRNLRNQRNTVEPEVTTRSRRTVAKGEITPDEKLKVARTIEIQLEPVSVDSASIEPVEKKTRSKRGTLAVKNAEKVEEETTVRVRTQRATKRATEPIEDVPEPPKKKRARAKAADEISSKEAEKPKNEEIVIELPKRTRGQAKTNVRVAALSPVNAVAKSTKAAKSKPIETLDHTGSSVSKKRTRDVGESSSKTDTEKSSKKTKILKNVEIIVPDKPIESVPAKKSAKKVISAKEPVASTSKTITPRMTRSRKTEVIKHEDILLVKNPPKETRTRKKTVAAPKSSPTTNLDQMTRSKKRDVDYLITKNLPILIFENLPKENRTRKKTVAAPKSSPTTNLDHSANSELANTRKSPVEEKVATKRTVLTRSKNISIKKGRISTTLKTSVTRKSLGKSSPTKGLPENNLPAANQRSTRRRAK